MLPAYEVPRDFARPTTEGCPRRACEERDLLEEAGNIEGLLTTIGDVITILYPPVVLGGVVSIPVVLN